MSTYAGIFNCAGTGGCLCTGGGFAQYLPPLTVIVFVINVKWFDAVRDPPGNFPARALLYAERSRPTDNLQHAADQLAALRDLLLFRFLLWRPHRGAMRVSALSLVSGGAAAPAATPTGYALSADGAKYAMSDTGPLPSLLRAAKREAHNL